MAAEETITILNVETGEAVKSVGDLRNNVRQLKANLEELEIGSDEYKDTLEELKVNQTALKNAMYATTTSMEDLTAAATGTAHSYNGLVAKMAALKEELRATDVSTKKGADRFAELAEEINAVNDELKAMDAAQGNFQRNVGNYEGALKNWGDTLKMVPPTLGSAKKALGDVGETLNVLGKNPVLGIVGLLAPIIMKVTAAVQDNDKAVQALDRAMGALQPIFDALGKVMDWIVGLVVQAVDWFTEWASSSSNTFGRIIAGATGVGNVILQSILTPVRTVIEAFKGLGNIIKDVFSGNFSEIKKHATDAFDGIGAAFRKGFSFEDNFKAGQTVGAEFMAGLSTTRKKAKEEGKAIADELSKAVADGLKEAEKEVEASFGDDISLNLDTKEMKEARKAELADLDAAAKHRRAMIAAEVDDEEQKAEQVYDIILKANERKLALLKQYAEEAAANGDLDAEIEYRRQAAAVETEIEENAANERKRIREREVKEAEETAKHRLEVMSAAADGASDILGSIADMYEASSQMSEKEAKKVKALRISAAVIDTISGAIKAFMSAQSLPTPANMIVGAVNAAAVTAAGVANIAKLRQSKISTSEGGGSSVPATVTAPAVSTEVQSVRNVTSASEEDRLNKMAADQRVYIVSSDIEAAQNDSRVRVQESTF